MMIQFTGYKKGYAGNEVIGIPSLQLGQGIYWLRGENGSGKTTLIKSIAGLVPFDGDIAVCGSNIRKDRIAYTSIVNYAEAEPAYPGFLTGTDLIHFYAKTKKAPTGQAEELCRKLGVDGYMDNKIATYSSGMAKKLSLVLGFIGKPKLILLDEPLITLDAHSVTVLQDIIVDLHAAGVSFIIISHQEVLLVTATVQRLLVQNKTLAVV